MNKETPLVSVIIPNYNYARYLKQRIESVLNQTFSDFELILLDDASKDESVDILESYRVNEHVTKIVVNDRNTGSPFRQWLKGITLARGKYVWIAEADDCANSLFLETCVKWMESNAGSAICYTGSILFNAEGQEEKRDVNHWGKRERKEASVFNGNEYAMYNLYWKNYIINASAVLFRRDYALNLASSAWADMRYCGDWLFWFGLSLQGAVIEVYRSLNFFRQHGAKATTASRRIGEGIKEDAQVVMEMERQLTNIPSYKKRLRRGLLYRKVKRMSLDDDIKQELYDYLSNTLNSSMSDYYLERRNQVLRLLLPHLLTAKRERL